VLDALRASGADELAVVARPDELSQIRRSVGADGTDAAAITFLAHHGNGGLLDALATAAPFVGDAPCVLHASNGLAAEPLAPFVQRVGTESADLMLLLHRSASKQDRLGPALCRSLGISELNGGRTCLCLAGVCFLGPGTLQHACIPLHDGSSELDLPDIVERIAGGGSHLQVGLLRAWRRYAGSPTDLLELNRMVLDQQPELGEEFDAGPENRIEGRVVIHPTAEVTSSVVLGPSIIGPRARVTNSYIGPYTSIGAGAQIEGAEIERSIVLDDARIMHVSARIEASTVGAHANIFRDFKIPRALRLHVGEGVELALN
jgi:glucose-1-phosphate thymidylyltransferase